MRLQATFKDSSAVLSDPTTVTLKVKPPSGATLTYTYALAEITKASTGVYYRDVTPDMAGMWWYRWYATGVPTSNEEGNFSVDEAHVT